MSRPAAPVAVPFFLASLLLPGLLLAHDQVPIPFETQFGAMVKDRNPNSERWIDPKSADQRWLTRKGVPGAKLSIQARSESVLLAFKGPAGTDARAYRIAAVRHVPRGDALIVEVRRGAPGSYDVSKASLHLVTISSRFRNASQSSLLWDLLEEGHPETAVPGNKNRSLVAGLNEARSKGDPASAPDDAPVGKHEETITVTGNDPLGNAFDPSKGETPHAETITATGKDPLGNAFDPSKGETPHAETITVTGNDPLGSAFDPSKGETPHAETITATGKDPLGNAFDPSKGETPHAETITVRASLRQDPTTRGQRYRVVSASEINMRSAPQNTGKATPLNPKDDDNVQMVLKKGAEVRGTGRVSGRWLEVTLPLELAGWVRNRPDVVQRAQEPANGSSSKAIYAVACAFVNLRSPGNLDSPLVILLKGTPVQQLDSKPGWIRVALAPGAPTTGWVMGTLLEKVGFDLR